MKHHDETPFSGTQLPHASKDSFMAVFSNYGFLLLWMGQLASQLADRLFVYVIMILAYTLTKTNLGVSLPLLAFGIPSVLIGPIAGVYVDRLDRKGIMIITAILRALMILMLIPLAGKSMIYIFIISLLIYSTAQFFAPAESSSIPELVKKNHLIVANSLFMITWMGASVLGLGLGAPFVHLLGEKGVFTVAAFLYFIAAAFIFLIPLKWKEPRQKETTRDVYKDLMQGIEFIRRNKIILISLAKLFVATSALAVVSLLAISYAQQILGIGGKNFGYLILSTGLGMFIGMPLLERLRKVFKKGSIVALSFIFSGFFFISLGLTSNVEVALILTFFLGMGNIFITSTIQTILQQQIPRQLRGRVFGVQNMLINSAFTLPVVIFGIIADFFSIPTALIVLGVIVFIAGIVGVSIPGYKNV